MDGNTVAAVVIAVLGSDVIKEIVKGLFGRKHDAVKRADLEPIHQALQTLKEGLMTMHADRLDHLMTVYLRDGVITDTQYKSLTNMHNSYKSLGGNSFIDDKFERVQELYKHQN